ncbi:MAG: type I restriction-modification system subunit M N-terminal domain-containing protein [Bradymonadaceae bacterium]|nr:type I restriction-modification system subunit M N-terminal domain-containing protein [Lujinxingiaceae bacterium]
MLGLIFLKYISDAFEERQKELAAEGDEEALEDRDEYIAENVFWVPKVARWSHIQGAAKQPTIGKILDDAMDEAGVADGAYVLGKRMRIT